MFSSLPVAPLNSTKKRYNTWVLPNDVNQDPQLDQTAHHSHSPVPHQHLARGLILEEEVREGAGDLALHLLSSADPRRGGSLSLSLSLSLHPTFIYTPFT